MKIKREKTWIEESIEKVGESSSPELDSKSFGGEEPEEVEKQREENLKAMNKRLEPSIKNGEKVKGEDFEEKGETFKESLEDELVDVTDRKELASLLESLKEQGISRTNVVIKRSTKEGYRYQVSYKKVLEEQIDAKAEEPIVEEVKEESFEEEFNLPKKEETLVEETVDESKFSYTTDPHSLEGEVEAKDEEEAVKKVETKVAEKGHVVSDEIIDVEKIDEGTLSGSKKVFSREELNTLENSLYRKLKEEGIYPESISFTVAESPLCDVDLYLTISGDWKHDHLFARELVKDFCKENKFVIARHDEDVTDSDGSDYYDALHTFQLVSDEKGDMDKVLSSAKMMFKKDEALKESFEEIYIKFWEDEELRDQGISEIYRDNFATREEAIETARKLVDRDGFASVEVYVSPSGEIESESDKLIWGYDGIDTWRESLDENTKEEKLDEEFFNQFKGEEEEVHENLFKDLDEEIDIKEFEHEASKGERIAEVVAKAFKGECGPFGGEDPYLDGNQLTLHSQGPDESWIFNDDGSVESGQTEDEFVEYADLDDYGCETEEELRDYFKTIEHFDTVEDLFNSGLSWFMDLENHDEILKEVDKILSEPIEEKKECKEETKEVIKEEVLDEMAKLPYHVLAWKLNEIISSMNNEEAYYDSGWLYIWPDGERPEDCEWDFNTKDAYEELRQLFEKVYKEYHEDGLYTNDPDIIEYAHKVDAKLGLEPIKNFGKVKDDSMYRDDDPYDESLNEDIDDEMLGSIEMVDIDDVDDDFVGGEEPVKEMSHEEKMDFLADDEQEAIDGYDEVIDSVENEHLKDQLEHIRDEEIAHKEFLDAAKKDPDVDYEDFEHKEEELVDAEDADDDMVVGELEAEEEVVEESLNEGVEKDFEKVDSTDKEVIFKYKGTGYFPEVVSRLQDKFGKFAYVDEKDGIIHVDLEKADSFGEAIEEKTIVIGPESKKVEIEIEDKSEVGEDGHPIQKGLTGLGNIKVHEEVEQQEEIPEQLKEHAEEMVSLEDADDDFGIVESLSDSELITSLVANGSCADEKEAKERVSRMSKEDKDSLSKSIKKQADMALLDD